MFRLELSPDFLDVNIKMLWLLSKFDFNTSWSKGQEAVPELDGKIALKILVGPA